MAQQEITITKINNLLSEIDRDRQQIFNTLRQKSELDKNDKIQSKKLSSLENINKSLLGYKNLLMIEKNNN
jgi:hypothetical protein